jgi:hypothetical protein
MIFRALQITATRRALSTLTVSPKAAASLWPTNDRKALEQFLLKPDLAKTLPSSPTSSLPNENKTPSAPENSAVGVPSPERIAQAQAEAGMMPTVDRFWMPEPLLYKKLDFSADYLASLEHFQTEIKVKFINDVDLFRCNLKRACCCCRP